MLSADRVQRGSRCPGLGGKTLVLARPVCFSPHPLRVPAQRQQPGIVTAGTGPSHGVAGTRGLQRDSPFPAGPEPRARRWGQLLSLVWGQPELGSPRSSGAVEVDRPLQTPDPRSGASEGAAPPHRLLPAVPRLSPTGGEADLICSARSLLCSELPGAGSGNSAQRISSGLQLEFPLLPPHFPRRRRAEGRRQGKSRGGVISTCSPFTWTIAAPRPPWSHTQWTVGMIP